jgi:hypothetical protein
MYIQRVSTNFAIYIYIGVEVFRLSNSLQIPFSWINFVKSILDDCGYSNVLHTQNFISHKWLIESIKLRLTDQFKQNWHSTLQISPKSLSYRLFQSDFRFEKYFRMTKFST